MNDIERLGEKLMKSGKGEDIKNLASSPEGQAISRMVDADALEKAAKSGNVDALKGILSQVMNTNEGKRLAETIQKMME